MVAAAVAAPAVAPAAAAQLAIFELVGRSLVVEAFEAFETRMAKLVEDENWEDMEAAGVARDVDSDRYQ